MARGECARIGLWMCWVAAWLITSIYVALALITFSKLFQASAEVFVDQEDFLKNKIWRAPLASCFLSALLVIGFDLLSCVTLIKKSINRAGPGFGYGFLVAFCFSLSFFLLLSGLVLDGFKKVIVDVLEQPGISSWTKYSSDTYMATLVFALISFVAFLLFGIILVILQGGMADQLGIETKPKYNPLYGPPPGETYDNPFGPGGAMGPLHHPPEVAQSFSGSDSAYKNTSHPDHQQYVPPAPSSSGVAGRGLFNPEATPNYQGAGPSAVSGYQNIPSDYQEQSSYYQANQRQAAPPVPQQQEYSYMGAPGTGSGYTGYGYASLSAAAPVAQEAASGNMLASDAPAAPAETSGNFKAGMVI